MEFPLFVYKKVKASEFETLLVEGEEQYKVAIDSGEWFATVPEALEGKQVAEPVEEQAVPADDAQPTREELEAKATELGLKFDGRTSDRKLGALISEALGE